MSGGLRRFGVEAAGESFEFFMGNAAFTVLSALAVIVIARLLGPSLYGLYSLSIVLPGVLIPFLGLGIDHAVIRESAIGVSRGDLSYARKIGNAIIFKAVIGLILTLVVYILSDSLSILLFKRPELAWYIRMSSILMLVAPLSLMLQFALVGLGRAGWAGGMVTVQSAIKLVLAALLILLGFSVTGALAGHIIGFLTGAAIGLLLVWGRIRKNVTVGDMLSSLTRDIRSMMAYGLPIYASVTLIGLAREYNYLVMAWNFTDAEVGGFAAGINAGTVMTVLAMPITLVMFLTFSKISDSLDDLRIAFRAAVKYTVLVLAPAASFVAILSKEIITLVYGPSYAYASTYLSIYSLLFLFYPFCFMVLWSAFNALALTRQTFIMGLIIVLVILPSSPILAMLLGVEGVVSTYLLAYGMAGVYGLSYAVKRLSLRFEPGRLARVYLSSALASLITIAILNLSKLGTIPALVTSAPTFLFSYLTFLGATRALSRDDLNNLMEMLGSIKLVGPLAAKALSYIAYVGGVVEELRK